MDIDLGTKLFQILFQCVIEKITAKNYRVSLGIHIIPNY